MSNPMPPPQPAAPDRDALLHAGRDLFQQRLTEIVRQSGVRLPAALDAFGREIGEAHDQLAAARQLDGFDQAADLTASRLTLLGDDDLELDIRVREVATHLREAGGRDLWRSRLRYMTLLRRPLMSEDAHPIGPDVICLGLWALCAQCGGTLEQRLALLDRLEPEICRQVAVIYREIDELLAGAGVEPAPGQTPPAAARAKSGDERTDGRQGAVDPLSALQQVMRQQRHVDLPAAFGNQRGDAGATSANPTLDAAAMVMLKHLLERLTALEARSTTAIADSAALESPPSPAFHALKAKDLDLPLGMPEAITLDTLGLIFEAIFDSAELPDTVKAAIARLQIPLLKLAIVDSSLFANSRHPARRLINRMARAAVGLPRAAGWEHPVCHRIGNVSVAVRERLAEKGAILDSYLAELDALIGEREQAIRLAAERHVPMIEAHENRQCAEQLARAWLRASLARTRSPEVASFLDRYWFRVMVAAALEGGGEGKRWHEDGATGEELIWSVLPKQSAEERKRLASLASSLIRRIGAGLDAIGVSSTERAPFLNILFDLQTAALRSQSQPTAGLPAEAPGLDGQVERSTHLAVKAGPCLLAKDGQRVHYLVLGVAAEARKRAAAADWQVGDWLRFWTSEQEPLCGLCCWQSPSSGTALLLNPDWGYSVAVAPSVLDQQISAGRAQIVSRIAVFDAAAERALSLLQRP